VAKASPPCRHLNRLICKVLAMASFGLKKFKISADKVRLKCFLGEEIRVMTVPHDIKFRQLVAKLEEIFGEGVTIHKYEDHVGDLITVHSKQDMREAFTLHLKAIRKQSKRSSVQPYLKLHLVKNGDGASPHTLIDLSSSSSSSPSSSPSPSPPPSPSSSSSPSSAATTPQDQRRASTRERERDAAREKEELIVREHRPISKSSPMLPIYHHHHAGTVSPSQKRLSVGKKDGRDKRDKKSKYLEDEDRKGDNNEKKKKKAKKSKDKRADKDKTKKQKEKKKQKQRGDESKGSGDKEQGEKRRFLPRRLTPTMMKIERMQTSTDGLRRRREVDAADGGEGEEDAGDGQGGDGLGERRAEHEGERSRGHPGHFLFEPVGVKERFQEAEDGGGSNSAEEDDIYSPLVPHLPSGSVPLHAKPAINRKKLTLQTDIPDVDWKAAKALRSNRFADRNRANSDPPMVNPPSATHTPPNISPRSSFSEFSTEPLLPFSEYAHYMTEHHREHSHHHRFVAQPPALSSPDSHLPSFPGSPIALPLEDLPVLLTPDLASPTSHLPSINLGSTGFPLAMIPGKVSGGVSSLIEDRQFVESLPTYPPPLSSPTSHLPSYGFGDTQDDPLDEIIQAGNGTEGARDAIPIRTPPNKSVLLEIQEAGELELEL